MIKKCKIILSNETLCVVDFDGIQVQLPPFKGRNKTYAYLECVDGVYSENTEAAFMNITGRQSVDIGKAEPINMPITLDQPNNSKKAIPKINV